MHGAPLHRGSTRGVRPDVPHDAVGDVVSVLRHVRPRRHVPHAPAARARRPPAGVLRQGGADAAETLPGEGNMRHRYANR